MSASLSKCRQHRNRVIDGVLSGLARPRPPALQEQETPSARGAAGTAWLSQPAPTSGIRAIESQGLETTSQAKFNKPCLHPNSQLSAARHQGPWVMMDHGS